MFAYRKSPWFVLLEPRRAPSKSQLSVGLRQGLGILTFAEVRIDEKNTRSTPDSPTTRVGIFASDSRFSSWQWRDKAASLQKEDLEAGDSSDSTQQMVIAALVNSLLSKP